MTGSKKGTVKTITIMIILGCIIFGGFYYVANREHEEPEQKEPTEIEKMLDWDLEKEYPPTAREVIKCYARIVKAVHSGEVTKLQVEQLGKMIRLLYSDQLLKENPQEIYMETLNQEVQDYAKAGRTVVSYLIDDADNAVKWTEKGKEYTRFLALFTLKDNKEYSQSCEEFILEKNSSEQWKIVGWRLADKEDMK